jgi:hypothetical protein
MKQHFASLGDPKKIRNPYFENHGTKPLNMPKTKTSIICRSPKN